MKPDSSDLFIECSRAETSYLKQLTILASDPRESVRSILVTSTKEDLERRIGEAVDLQKRLIVEVTEEELKVLRERYISLIKGEIHPQSVYNTKK